MIRPQFDPKNKYTCVVYLRMSSDKQNPRSPDQQLATIQETLKRLRLNWRIVAIYRDDAISGRYSDRPGYLEMIRDLKLKKVQADLVLVDTFERLTRSTQATAQREKFRKMGLLILSANNQFADPTTPQGRAFTLIEDMRVSADGEVKAHNVLRGKRDAVRRGRWPGGPPPCGYRLEATLAGGRLRSGDSYSRLVPDQATRWIIEEAYRLADALGFGTNRIARALKDHPRLPPELKPLHHSTIGGWLDNRIYVGEFIWGENATDIIDNVRKTERRPEEEWERHPGFCEALVSEEVWERVHALRTARGKKAKEAKEAKERERTLHGIPGIHAPGIALKYPLSGLVRCQHCGRAMTPSSSRPFITLSGESRRYVAYSCPAYPSRACSNNQRIPEDWLREVVMDLIRRRLFLE